MCRQVKGEKGALARQRSELQACADRQQGQLTEARALQAAPTAAMARVSYMLQSCCLAAENIAAMSPVCIWVSLALSTGMSTTEIERSRAAQLDKQLVEKTSQLAEAHAAVAQLQTDRSAAEAIMRNMTQQSGQQQELILKLQEAVLRCAISRHYGIACTA